MVLRSHEGSSEYEKADIRDLDHARNKGFSLFHSVSAKDTFPVNKQVLGVT